MHDAAATDSLTMTIDQLKPNKILHGAIFPEPVQVIVTIPMGDAVKLVAKGVNTMRVYEPILTFSDADATSACCA